MYTTLEMVRKAVPEHLQGKRPVHDQIWSRPYDNIPALIRLLTGQERLSDKEHTTAVGLLIGFKAQAIAPLTKALGACHAALPPISDIALYTKMSKSICALCTALEGIGMKEQDESSGWIISPECAVPELFEVATTRTIPETLAFNSSAMNAIASCGPTAILAIPDGLNEILRMFSVLLENPSENPDGLSGLELGLQSIASLLGELGATGSPGVGLLVEAFEHKNEGVRIEALKALTEIGPPAASALIPIISNPDAFGVENHTLVRKALSAIKRPTDSDIPELVEIAKRGCGATECYAIQVLVSVPHRVGMLRDHCIVALASLNKAYACQAAVLLREFRTSDSTTVSALLQMLKSRNQQRSSVAATTLGALRPVLPGVVEALIALLNLPHDGSTWHRRISAITALGFLGSHAQSAVKPLQIELENANPETVEETALAISAITGAPVDVPDLATTDRQS